MRKYCTVPYSTGCGTSAIFEHGKNTVLGLALFENDYSLSIRAPFANISPMVPWNSVSTNQANLSTSTCTQVHWKFAQESSSGQVQGSPAYVL